VKPEIRKPKLRDLPKLFKLMDSAYRHGYRGLGLLWARLQTLDNLLIPMYRDCLLVADYGDEEAVAAIAWTEDGDTAIILWLAVDEAYRRRGIATALKLEFEHLTASRGLKRIKTRIREENKAALGLNLKLGYKILERRGAELWLEKALTPIISRKAMTKWEALSLLLTLIASILLTFLVFIPRLLSVVNAS